MITEIIICWNRKIIAKSVNQHKTNDVLIPKPITFGEHSVNLVKQNLLTAGET